LAGFQWFQAQEILDEAIKILKAPNANDVPNHSQGWARNQTIICLPIRTNRKFTQKERSLLVLLKVVFDPTSRFPAHQGMMKGS